MLPEEFMRRMPDELLELCLAACPPGSRGSLRLVSKRVKDSCDRSHEVCSKLTLWRAGRRDPAALARVAVLPFSAADLAIDMPGALDVAQKLTGLTWLALNGVDCDDTHDYGAVLAQHPFSLTSLPQLRHLRLEVDNLRPTTCAQLSALKALEVLDCGTFWGQLPRELWASLACMPLLRQLEICALLPPNADGLMAVDECHVPEEAWDALRNCTHLSHLELRSYAADPFALAPGIAILTSLRRVTLETHGSSYGDLWSHPSLTSLQLSDGRYRDMQEPPAPAMHLPPADEIDLPALLDLSLCWGSGSVVIPGQMARLSTVTSLTYTASSGPHDLEPLWQLPRLASLDLSDTVLRKVLRDGILQLSGLRALNLSSTGLSSMRELPDGPYLWGLRTLLLADNKLTRLPPVLRRAKQLEVLDMSHHRSKTGGPQLELEDLPLLLKMRALCLLCVPSRRGTNLRMAMLFNTWLPRLEWDESSVSKLNLLFPRGWHGGMDEGLHAACLKQRRQDSEEVRGSVLRTLGR